MSYSAEDFKNARFAFDPRGRLAMRDLSPDHHPWTTSEREAYVAASDDDLAASGWYPVHEHDQSAAETIADVRALATMRQDIIDIQRERLDDIVEKHELELREAMEARAAELARERDIAPDLVTVDVLRARWESADIPDEDDPIREGDEYIASASRSFETDLPFVVGIAGKDGAVTGWSPRILSRAPRREPWQGLADVMRGLPGVDGRYGEEIARKMHAAGVRVTGGDDE